MNGWYIFLRYEGLKFKVKTNAEISYSYICILSRVIIHYLCCKKKKILPFARKCSKFSRWNHNQHPGAELLVLKQMVRVNPGKFACPEHMLLNDSLLISSCFVFLMFMSN